MKRVQFLKAFLLFIFAISGFSQSILAQVKTGTETLNLVAPPDCAWCGEWEFFDFSEGLVFSIEDTALYEGDIRGSSNEGVNFGKEFSPEILENRIILLGFGEVDTVTSVPVWTGVDPWISTSWDFQHGTQGSPLSEGQLWGVFTKENHYAVIEITSLPDGNFGNSLVFKYKYQPNGSRFFDATPVDEEPEMVYQISIESGNNQQVQTTKTTPEKIIVFVEDQDGNPVAGETVNFSFEFVITGSSQFAISDSVVTTDENGMAGTFVTLGNKQGEYMIKANLASNPEKAVWFDLVAKQPNYNLETHGGDFQAVEVGSITPNLLSVVLKDEAGNLIEGEQIGFRFIQVPPGASGHSILTENVQTDPLGIAGTALLMGNIPGSYIVQAYLVLDAEKSILFIINAKAKEPSTIIIVDGNNQSALPGETLLPLTVAVLDEDGTKLKNHSIKFEEVSKPENASSGLFKTLDGITTNNVSIFDSTASIKYTLGSKPGIYSVKGSLSGYPDMEAVIFNLTALSISSPAELTAQAGAGSVQLNWSEVGDAAKYNIYRSVSDDNPATASLLHSTSSLSYMDVSANPEVLYYYWVKAVDAHDNESTTSAGPASAIPTELSEAISGTGMIIALSGSGFSKTWQYFDFSKGMASNETDTENLADFRGTSNEGVNFGNENAPQIEGRRIILLGEGSLDEITSVPVWNNENPWIFNSWDFSDGTGGAPLSEGQLWGVYTQEGHYAIMEITNIPNLHGDTLGFTYKYKADGSPVFGTAPKQEPDSLTIVFGNDQQVLLNTTAFADLVVQVVDSDKNGIDGITVNFSFLTVPQNATGHSISAQSVISGDGGFAKTNVTVGNKEGDYLVQAEVDGIEPVIFTLFAEQAPPPQAIELIKVESLRANALMPVWVSSKDPNFLRYRVYMSTDNKSFSQVDSTNRDFNQADSSAVINDLNNLQEYYFKVAVVNKDLQESAFSNTLSAFPYPDPEVPQNVKASAGDGAVQLSWAPVKAQNFAYYYIMAGMDGYEITARDTLFNNSDTLKVIRNLSNNETYQFYVIAVNEFGRQSPYSAKVTAIPQASYEERVTEIISLMNGSSAWADIDNDGDLDMVKTGINSDSEPQTLLYLSDGNGNFTLNPQQFLGVSNSTVFFYDIDLNGYLDLIISGNTQNSAMTKVYLNQQGSFVDAGFELPALGNGSISPNDFDNDGDPDFLVTGEDGTNIHTLLIKNNGKGNFTLLDIQFVGLIKSSSAWDDYNGDGYADLLLAGEDADGKAVTKVYKNQGNDQFVDAGIELTGVINGSVAWADFNMDNKPDILVSGFLNSAQTTLFAGFYLNIGNGFNLFHSFKFDTGAAKATDHAGKSIMTVGDYDNDGDLDVLLSSAAAGSATASILKNNGSNFLDEKLDLEDGETIVWIDYDGDGDLDMVITGSTSGGGTKILNNTTEIKNTPPTLPTDLHVEIEADSAMLNWSPATDMQTPSALLSYNVRIGSAAGESDMLAANADLMTGKLRMQAKGNAGNKTTLLLQGLTNGTYYWQVQAIDNGFMSSAFTQEQIFEVTNSLVSTEIDELPIRFALNQNYPNPFNPSTSISFSLPYANDVKLEIFDITGRLVATLVDGQMAAGNHTITFNADYISSGIYIYRMAAQSGKVFSKKMTLIK